MIAYNLCLQQNCVQRSDCPYCLTVSPAGDKAHVVILIVIIIVEFLCELEQNVLFHDLVDVALVLRRVLGHGDVRQDDAVANHQIGQALRHAWY